MLRRVFALALIAHVTAAETSLPPPSATYPPSFTSTAYPPSTTAAYHGTVNTAEVTQLERPHKPVVTTTDDVTQHRHKRDNNDTNKTNKRRVVTGATVLSISGTLRDSISAPLSPSAASASVSRVSALVIRPAAAATVSAPTHSHNKVAVNKSNARELVVSPHTVASLDCDLINATQVKWYKDGEPVTVAPSSSSSGSVWWSEAGGVKVRAGRGETGSWRCAGRSASGGTLAGQPIQLALYESVRGVYLSVDNRRLDANTWMPLRESTPLSLACVAEGGVPAPELSWRLINGDVTLDLRHYLHVETNNGSAGEGVSRSVATVTATRELHNASLLCRASQRVSPDIQQTTQEAKLELHVTYPPSFVISRRPGFGVPLQAGGGAVLRCDVDSNPPSQPWWTRDQETTATSSPPPLGRAGWSEIKWSRLSPAHGGWYRCRAVWSGADYSSIGYYLNVQGTDEESELPQESVDEAEGEDGREDRGERGDELSQHHVNVPLGGSVQLHCPKGSVGCWWRRSVGRGWSPAGSHHAHGVLGIRDAIYQEGGEYRCVGVDGAGALRELKRVTLSVTGGPQASALSSAPSTSGWRLVCGACGRGVSARWLLPRGHWTQTPLTPETETDNSLDSEAPQCWRTQLLLKTPHTQDVLCVVTGTDGGAVAVFPARVPPSPAHPRHLTASRAASASASTTLVLTLVTAMQSVRASG